MASGTYDIMTVGGGLGGAAGLNGSTVRTDMTRWPFVRLKNYWRTDMPWEDPIVEEVRKVRGAYAHWCQSLR